MKTVKNLSRIIAVLLILTMCLPFVFACGEKSDAGTSTTESNAGTEANPTEEAATTTAAPTDPPTEKETLPPTEPPTDPAELPAPDVISEGFEIIPGARYYLWSPNSHLYLTADGDYKYAGICQDEFTGGPDQMFVFEKVREEEVADGVVRYVYKIRVLGTRDSYLDIEDADVSVDGASVICMSEPEGEGSQEWTLKKQSRGKIYEDSGLPVFSVMSSLAKNSKCLDVDGVSLDPGHKVHLWSGGTANNQKWFFELVSDVESGKIMPHGLQEIPEEE